jgi:hypothetical protein
MAPQRNHHKARGASLAIASDLALASASLKVFSLNEIKVVQHADPNDPGQHVKIPKEKFYISHACVS